MPSAGFWRRCQSLKYTITKGNRQKKKKWPPPGHGKGDSGVVPNEGERHGNHGNFDTRCGWAEKSAEKSSKQTIFEDSDSEPGKTSMKRKRKMQTIGGPAAKKTKTLNDEHTSVLQKNSAIEAIRQGQSKKKKKKVGNKKAQDSL